MYECLSARLEHVAFEQIIVQLALFVIVIHEDASH